MSGWVLLKLKFHGYIAYHHQKLHVTKVYNELVKFYVPGFCRPMQSHIVQEIKSCKQYIYNATNM